MNRILILILVIYNLSAAAQPSKELAEEAKAKFAGKWIGLSGGDSLTIYLIQTVSKMEIVSPPKPVDTIALFYGWHQISRNMTVIESTLDSQASDLRNGFSVIGVYKKSNNKISLILKDLTRNISLEGEFQLFGQNKAILVTRLKEVWRNDDKRYQEGQTFPKEIQLIRQPIEIK
jgi:hypothetical protein